METRTLQTLLFLNLVVGSIADFTSSCPEQCKCFWASGNKQADCSYAKFGEIPTQLSTDIQILNLTANDLYEIKKNAFEDAYLNNLKKLVLRECKLITIHKNGLSGLSIMIELDLSKNDLIKLEPDTFKETSKIRWILLNDNKLEKLEDGLFNNLPFLQKVDLSNNHLQQIGVKTFMNVPKLNNLRLENNKLERLKIDALSAVTSLSTLELRENPWRCDCFLQPFRNWVISKNLYTTPISCAEPAKAHGKLWKELDSSDFACRPSIVYPSTSTTLKTADSNVTLCCQVNGNPLPEVNWVLNSQIIDPAFRYQGEIKYNISLSSSDNSKWVNLTIVNAEITDNGEYLCVAKNPGGVEERSVTLALIFREPGIDPPPMDSNMLPVLIGVACTAAILLIVLALLCYCCCRRRHTEKMKGNTSNGEALIEGSVIPEMEKSLITAVNPVTKPPRRYDVPPSITSGATEMSELNKTLLDNDCVFAHHDDEKRSLDFDHQKRSQDALNVEYGRSDGRMYPPDLLAFPARAAQISPAASNASTVPDTTRLPQQINPVSPIHSPIYGMTTNQNLFRTLPYSRSQSPFVAPITPPVVNPRQGYVTIPRRPRVPSWSSTASTQILPSAEAQEPLYDNLGLRTTADGSSVLSLNKAGLENPMSPMRNRPLPATPTVYPNPHQVYYAPIEEQEPAPSPVPPLYMSNPRNSISSQLSTQMSTPGPQEPLSPRMSWTAKNTSTPQHDSRKALFNDNRNSDTPSHISDNSTLSRKGKPETGSLRRYPRQDTKDEVISPSKDEMKNDNNISQISTLGRNGKIPPRPPPKPKKKPITDNNSNEPLFEDEGEDGTEV